MICIKHKDTQKEILLFLLDVLTILHSMILTNLFTDSYKDWAKLQYQFQNKNTFKENTPILTRCSSYITFDDPYKRDCYSFIEEWRINLSLLFVKKAYFLYY